MQDYLEASPGSWYYLLKFPLGPRNRKAFEIYSTEG